MQMKIAEELLLTCIMEISHAWYTLFNVEKPVIAEPVIVYPVKVESVIFELVEVQQEPVIL